MTRFTAASEFRLPGSTERAVGSNGEFNANDRAELIRVHKMMLASLQAGGPKMVTQAHAEEAAQRAQLHKEMMLAAFDSPEEHRNVGQVLANQLNVSSNKQGLMRNFLTRQELAQGQRPTATLQMKNAAAIVASGPVRCELQPVRDQHYFPAEFYIHASPFIEQRDIVTATTDVMQQKYIESMESIMVMEDRTWRLMAQNTIGMPNSSTTVVGALTPLVLSNVRNQVTRHRIPARSLLFASDLWTDVVSDLNFSNVLDPVSKHELFLEGQLATMLGMAVYTDAYRHSTHQVLSKGEFWVIGEQDHHGQYTDRGGVTSEPITQAMAGIPGRGWYLHEVVSMTIANSRSIARGIRT